MMTEADFESTVQGQQNASKLEAWIAVSDELIREGNDVPDGGEWTGSDGQGLGIQQVSPVVREAYRNYCTWRELTQPSGETGVYVVANASNADRFL